jgi:hypothetical protein
MRLVTCPFHKGRSVLQISAELKSEVLILPEAKGCVDGGDQHEVAT